MRNTGFPNTNTPYRETVETQYNESLLYIYIFLLSRISLYRGSEMGVEK